MPSLVSFSGVATLGHAGARESGTKKILKSNGAVSLCITPNYESHTLIIREFAVSDLHFATVYGSEPTWNAVKFLNFRGEAAPRPPYKLLHFAQNCSVPMLCPGDGDVLATPLVSLWLFMPPIRWQ